MPTDFNDFDLTSALDKEAFSILDQGNSDLVFGGSSVQEAEVFGQQINSSDSVKVGAFLGGVALANLKVQQQRTERFNRIRSLQDEIREREGLQLRRDGLNETRRSNAAQELLSTQRLSQNASQFETTSDQAQQRITQTAINSTFDQGFANKQFNSKEAQLKVQNTIANAQLQIDRGNADRAQLDSDSLRHIQTYLVEVGNLDASTVLNASPGKALQAYTRLVGERNSQPLTNRPAGNTSVVVDPNDL